MFVFVKIEDATNGGHDLDGSNSLIVMLGTWLGTISYQLFTVACLVHILAIVALNSKDACGYEPEPFDSYN